MPEMRCGGFSDNPHPRPLSDPSACSERASESVEILTSARDRLNLSAVDLREVPLLGLETMIPAHLVRLTQDAAVPLYLVLLAVHAHVHLLANQQRERRSRRRRRQGWETLATRSRGEAFCIPPCVPLSSQACPELVEGERDKG